MPKETFKNIYAVPTFGTASRNNRVFPSVEWLPLAYSKGWIPVATRSHALSYHAPPCFCKRLLFFLYSSSGIFFCSPFFIFSPLSFYFFKAELEFTRAVPFKNVFCILVFLLFIYLTNKRLIIKKWDSSKTGKNYQSKGTDSVTSHRGPESPSFIWFKKYESNISSNILINIRLIF